MSSRKPTMSKRGVTGLRIRRGSARRNTQPSAEPAPNPRATASSSTARPVKVTRGRPVARPRRAPSKKSEEDIRSARSTVRVTTTTRSTDKYSKYQNPLNIDKRVEARESIVLQGNQVEHLDDIVEVYSHFPAVISTSQTGAGKTYVSAFVYQEFDFNGILVVGPLSSRPEWVKVFERYGINGSFITFETLRGIKGKTLNHPYLTRHANRLGDTYEVTDYFDHLIRNKLLLVVDEAHAITNDSLQTRATSEMTSYLVNSVYDSAHFTEEERQSRLIVLSATYFERPENSIMALRTVGILKSENLYRKNPITGRNTFLGLNEIADRAGRLDAATTQQIMAEYPVTQIDRDSAARLAFELYTRVVSPMIQLTMLYIPSEEDAQYEHPIVNKHFILEGTDRANYLRALEQLERNDPDDGSEGSEEDDGNAFRYRRSNAGFAKIARPLHDIESAKVNAVIEDVKRVLETYPTSKAIVLQYNLDNLQRIYEALQEYNPQIMTGSTTGHRRMEIMDRFQEDSNEYRVIVSQIAVGGQSISLHDTHGGRPRFMWVTPRHSVKMSVQAAGRVNRRGVRSPSLVIFTFGNPDIEERRILASAEVKSEVMRQTYEETKREDIVLPSDYPTFRQGEESEYEDIFEDYLQR